jgi:Mrp family chromosome partitioning ATPase
MAAITPSLGNVKQVVLVLSGKGGVGKSTVATQLALSLVKNGQKVGILDVDICGPSIPQMLGLGDDKDIHQSDLGWVPVYMDKTQTLGVMSIAFLLKSKNEAVIWRGPKKHSMIKQFIENVYWSDLDVLVIDTPPGTSDEHMSVMESLKSYPNKGAVLVTTPQLVSITDVRREITFCQKTGIPIIGIVENYSSFKCPNCDECTPIFAENGGELLAKEAGIELLAKIPIDPDLVKCGESGQNFIETFGESDVAKIFDKLQARVREGPRQ